MKSYTAQRRLLLIFRHALSIILLILWILPIVWIVLASFSYNDTGFVSTLWPEKLTLQDYIGIFTSLQYPFGSWIINTLIISIIPVIISTFIIIPVAYVLLRSRFKLRKPFPRIVLVLGMSPDFMVMIALRYVLKGLNMLNLGGLLLVYVGGAGLGFCVAKGFFDIISRAIDEAVKIDGATKRQVFWNIGLPSSRPMIVYTVLTAFIGPWVDFILSGITLSTSGDVKICTIAYGSYNMVHNSKGVSTTYFAQLIVGCAITAIPITILFIFMQKFYVNGTTVGADKG